MHWLRIRVPKAREMLTICAEKGDEQSARMLAMMDAVKGMFKNLKKSAKR